MRASRKVPLGSNTLSLSEARRIALHAQGFGSARDGPPSRAQMLRTIKRIGLLQLDSVNVLVGSHYLPLFARFADDSPDVASAEVFVIIQHRRKPFHVVPVVLDDLPGFQSSQAQKLARVLCMPFHNIEDGVATAHCIAVCANLGGVEVSARTLLPSDPGFRAQGATTPIEPPFGFWTSESTNRPTYQVTPG